MASQGSERRSQREVILKLRAYAQNPKTCKEIVNNSQCLKSLVDTLNASEQETRLYAVQTLLLIARNPSHAKKVAQMPGLTQKLTFLQDSPNQNIAKTTQKLCQYLRPRPPQLKQRNLNKPVQRPKRSVKSHYLQTIQIPLQLNTKEEKSLLTQSIMKANLGVVSVVFNSESTSFFGNHDVKRQDVINFLEEKGFSLRPQKDTRIHEGEGSHSKKMLKRYSQASKGKTETLAQRLQRQKKEREEKEAKDKQAAGLLSGITGYFW